MTIQVRSALENTLSQLPAAADAGCGGENFAFSGFVLKCNSKACCSKMKLEVFVVH